MQSQLQPNTLVCGRPCCASSTKSPWVPCPRFSTTSAKHWTGRWLCCFCQRGFGSGTPVARSDTASRKAPSGDY
eukprot:11202906-Lingulodinium_polyedra.AAC.1